jgi:tRNA(Arg) A34 adenosine deaminase TadA
MTREEIFMQEAIHLSEQAVLNNEGGPFGCVIVKNDVIIGRGYNKVTSTNDPTAHAEIVAIRDACKNIGNFLLEGCEVYTSCEPCPMCLGAIYWSKPKNIYFANTRKDADSIGFSDNFIYQEINKELADRKIPIYALSNESAIKVFNDWALLENKILY